VGPSVFYLFICLFIYLFIFIHVAETLKITIYHITKITTNSEPTTMTYKACDSSMSHLLNPRVIKQFSKKKERINYNTLSIIVI